MSRGDEKIPMPSRCAGSPGEDDPAMLRRRSAGSPCVHSFDLRSAEHRAGPRHGTSQGPCRPQRDLISCQAVAL